jgi:hypothetical protein
MDDIVNVEPLEGALRHTLFPGLVYDILRGSYAPRLLSMPIGALPATPNATKPQNCDDSELFRRIIEEEDKGLWHVGS